jgi:cytochrome c oxidase subunit 2
MWTGSPLFPETASTIASRVDALYFFLVGVSTFFSLLIAGLIVFFAIKYRRRSPDEVGAHVHGRGAMIVEATWTIVPLIIVLVIFVWSASVFSSIARPPDETLNIYVVGKQWMWKFQHLSGQREINELHVPVGRPVKLIMTSEDVIHDVFVPAFRVKADVIPGRYSHIWFEATKAGSYHLFCAEYCGTQHYAMTGRVVVMEPADFERWLSERPTASSLASAGERLFAELACNTCHVPDSPNRGPMLGGLFGATVRLEGGETARADEAYLRESIVNPNGRITAGFQPVMPAYQGLISEENLLELVEYIKTLPAPRAAVPAAGGVASGPARDGVAAGQER